MKGSYFSVCSGFAVAPAPLDSLRLSDRAAGPTLRHTLHHTHAHALTPFHIDTCLHARTHSQLILPHFLCIMDGFPRKKKISFPRLCPPLHHPIPFPQKKAEKSLLFVPPIISFPPLVRRGCYCCGCIERCLSFLLRVCERCLVALYQFFELFPSLHFPFLRGMDASAWYESRSAIAVGGVLKHVGAYKRAWFSAACANALMVIQPK